jgi:hypothetical protein
MVDAFKPIRDLCTPAFVYVVLSIAGLVLMIYQNMGNTSRYCVGNVHCSVPNTGGMFIFEIIWIVFWTWILNLICKSGYTSVAWFLVLLPFVVFLIFVIIFADMVLSNKISVVEPSRIELV